MASSLLCFLKPLLTCTDFHPPADIVREEAEKVFPKPTLIKAFCFLFFDKSVFLNKVRSFPFSHHLIAGSCP